MGSIIRYPVAGVAIMAAVAAISPAAINPAAADASPWLTLSGLVDARLILTDTTVGWESGSLGKTRYGAATTGTSRLLARVADVSLIARADLSWNLSGFAHLVANSQQDNTVDVAEAFIAYRPAPSGDITFRARAGALIPPISLENTGLAWTSPYTITPSAINSWVGEELKSIGPEATAIWRRDDLTVSLTGSVYTGNDTAGTELAWRGWALHDRKAGVFERLDLAPVKIIQATSTPRISQAPYSEPGDEIDDRLGFMISAKAESDAFGQFYALHYDNRADDTVIKKGQWAWRTAFTAVGLQTVLGDDVDVIAQYMKGTTSIITRPPAPSVVKAGYESGFLLFSRGWNQHRVSARAEFFKADDRDPTPDNNAETGTALTAAYVLRPTDRQRLTLEVLHIHSKRPERTRSFGLPATANETQIQVSYRFFL